MKNVYLLLLFVTVTLQINAQVGVGTTTPNSTLDVRGSFSSGYRSFTTGTAAISTDNYLVFTGTAATTLTLPDATTCTGRNYWIKNASATLPTPVLTVSTVSAQTIDGLASWIVDEVNGSILLVSNGANWHIASQSVPANSGNAWIQGGNNITSAKTFGSISNYDLPFITNNTEKMRLSASGNLGIGTATFNASYPEKLIVNAGVTTSVNAIVGKGSINNYLQLNIQNSNAGTNASSDVVATADNGSETTNFVDLGINSSVNTSGIMGAANDAYLYNIGQNFLIGTGVASKALIFMTGGTAQSTNERMRIDGTGNVGIGTTNPGNKLEVNSGTGGVSGLRLKQLPSGAVLFMGASGDVSQNNGNFYFDATNYRLSISGSTTPASTLQVGGSIASAISTKTASYTAGVSDHTILCNNTTGAITITLPLAAGCTGRIYVIKKISIAGNNVTLQGNSGAENIDGTPTRILTNQYDALMVQSDGTAWYIVSKN